MYLKVAKLALLLICKGLACRIRSHHSGITLFRLAHKYSRSVGNRGEVRLHNTYLGLTLG